MADKGDMDRPTGRRATHFTQPVTTGVRVLRIFSKLAILATLSAGVYFAPPFAFRLGGDIYAYYLRQKILTLPPNEVVTALYELNELGPAGCWGLVTALKHQDPAVGDLAERLAWQKVSVPFSSAESAEEAATVVRALCEQWQQLPKERRGVAARILQHFLESSSAQNPRDVLLAKWCAAVLRDSGGSRTSSVGTAKPAESVPLSGVLPGAAELNTPALRNPLRSSAAVTSVSSMTVSEPSHEEVSTEPVKTGTGGSLLPHPEPVGQGPGGPNSSSSPPGPIAVDGESSGSLEVAPRSFGPGQVRRPIRLAPQERPSDSLENDESPGILPAAFDERWPSDSSDDLVGQAADHEGENPPQDSNLWRNVSGDIKDNPWLRDRELFCQLTGLGAPAQQAWVRLRQLGWTETAIELGRLAFHPDPRERLRAVGAAWNTPGVDPLPLILHLARDSDPAVRREAIATLATVPVPNVQLLVQQLIASDPSPQVRALGEDLARQSQRTPAKSSP